MSYLKKGQPPRLERPLGCVAARAFCVLAEAPLETDKRI